MQYNKTDSNYTELISCGVDEAGRGPLAGSVYAAAVILDINNRIDGLDDSKKLSEPRREFLYNEIIQKSLAWNIAYSTCQEIDELNILQATLLAMKRAIEGLHIKPQIALIDGNKAPNIQIDCKTIVKGDSLIQSISAASILAKVSRDRELVKLDLQYPQYGFAKHKGYGTKIHLEALKTYGPLPNLHRFSFAPVYNSRIKI